MKNYGKPSVPVMTSTSPRWPGNVQPEFAIELYRRLNGADLFTLDTIFFTWIERYVLRGCKAINVVSSAVKYNALVRFDWSSITPGCMKLIHEMVSQGQPGFRIPMDPSLICILRSP